MLTQHCIAFLQSLPLQEGETILVALSGGRDSVALFQALLHLYQSRCKALPPFRLAVAHLNHQNRGEDSWRDANFVAEMMAPYEKGCPSLTEGETVSDNLLPPIPLYMAHQDVPLLAKEKKRGFEEVAREERYGFLERMADRAGAQWIATAHHAGDNAETLIFHLARGCGLQGLGGIAPVAGRIIRPLLWVTRTEIDQFLAERQQQYHEDLTNADLSYGRNRIRHQVLPQLEVVNPRALAHCAQTIAILREEDRYLNQLVAEQLPLLPQGEGRGVSLVVAQLLALPPALQLRGVQYAVSQVLPQCTLSHGQREQILAVAKSEKPSAVFCTNYLNILRTYGIMVFCEGRHSTQEAVFPTGSLKQLVSQGLDFSPWGFTITKEIYQGQDVAKGQESQENHSALWVSTQSPLVLRSRQIGDRLTLVGRPTKTLKKWMIDQKIPARERERLAILAPETPIEGQVAGVLGLGVSSHYLPKVGEEAWHLLSNPPLVFQR